MKCIKKQISAVILAIALLATGYLAAGNGKVAALSPDYNGESNTVYYIFDYYPTLPYSAMEPKYGSEYNIVYDHVHGGPDFESMVENGYFEGFGGDCYVIIDIKTYMPNTYVLEDLFSGLKNQGCKTAFVTVYDESEFKNASFMNSVDKFIKDDFSALKELINDCLTKSLNLENAIIDDYGKIYFNTCFFLDERFIYLFEGNNFIHDFEILCEKSIFLTLFVDQCRQILGQYMDVPEDYNKFAEFLSNLNIKFLVYSANYGMYVDILKFKGNLDPYEEGMTYPATGIFDALIGNEIEHFYGFGFWELSSTLYDTLLEGQGILGQDEMGRTNLPIYIIEVDPINYADAGLAIIAAGVSAAGEDLMGWIGS